MSAREQELENSLASSARVVMNLLYGRGMPQTESSAIRKARTPASLNLLGGHKKIGPCLELYSEGGSFHCLVSESLVCTTGQCW